MSKKLQLVRNYEYDANDLAVAFYAVATEHYGADSLSAPKKFGFIEQSPLTITSVQVGLNEQATGVLGSARINKLSVNFQVGLPTMQGVQPTIVASKVKLGQRNEVEDFLDAIKEHLDHHSIYRGKAITAFGEFLDLSGVAIENIVYNEKVLRDLKAHVWTVIEQSGVCAGTKVGLTRKVLFEGPYGSGKTLAAFLTAQKAVKNGWGFFYLPPTDRRDTQAIQRVMSLAKKYQSSVVFIEDIDREQRESSPYVIGSILTEIDGLASKNAQILVVMTTNHIDKVTGAMQRPGRIDKVIHFGAYTVADIRRLLTLTIPAEWLDRDDVDWNAVADACEGFSPAFVAEVGKSALLLAISEAEGKTPHVKESVLLEAAKDLQGQHKKALLSMGFDTQQ